MRFNLKFKTLKGDTGQIIPNTKCVVLLQDNSPANVYNVPEGGTSIGSVVYSDSTGSVSVYLDTLQYYKVHVYDEEDNIIDTWEQLDALTVTDVTELSAQLDNKVDAGDLDDYVTDAELSSGLSGKANTIHDHSISDINGLQTTLNNKSDTGHGHQISDVTDLQNTLDGKAPTTHNHAISDVSGLQDALGDKADTVHSHAISDVTGLQGALDGKASITQGNLADTAIQPGDNISELVNDADYIPASEKGVADGIVPLNMSAKIDVSYLPSIVLVDTFTADSEAEMLSLSGAEQGDVCIRTDISKSFILTNNDPSSLSNWQELLSPAGGVVSINGQTGTVLFEGAVTSILTANLSPSRLLVSNSSGKVAVSTVTNTEVEYLSGVTSPIQDQLNSKQDTLIAGTNITIDGNTISADGSTYDIIGVSELNTGTASTPRVISATVLNTWLSGKNYLSNGTSFNFEGDVTGTGTSASAITLTLADGAVSNSKLADMSANTLKGRITGTGDPQDLTPAQARALLNVEEGATANLSDSYLLDRENHSGTQTLSTISDAGILAGQDTITKSQISDFNDSDYAGTELATPTTSGLMSSEDKGKLDDIDPEATANQPDSYLLDRTNHTGVQPISSVSGLQSELDGKATSAQGALADTAVQPDDPGMSDTREWSAITIPQAEAEYGTNTVRRAWTAQRVRQATVAWWDTVGTEVGKNLLNLANPGETRFIRINSDNSISTRTAAEFRTDIGAGDGGGGTVTSVGLSAPAGFNVANSPVTSSDTLVLTYASGYQGYTTEEADKLENIEENANNYTLPVAGSNTLGGVELFSDTVQPAPANPVTSIEERTYGLQLNSDGQAVVNVPWTDTSTIYEGSDSIVLDGTSFQRAALTGDVTASINSNETLISNNAVSNTKLADMAPGTIKGRIDSGVGDPQDLTSEQVRTLLNVEDGATVNQPDSYLLDRANHTGTQSITTITGLGTAATANLTTTKTSTTLGDVVKVGDYGIGLGMPAVSAGSCRDLIIPGNYLVTEDVTDRPVGSGPGIVRVLSGSLEEEEGYDGIIAAGPLRVMSGFSGAQSSNGVIVQIYNTYGSNQSQYFCTFDGTTWTDWENVLTSESVISIDNITGLGTAALEDSSAFASAGQGNLADTAVQPGDNISSLTNDAGYILSTEKGSANGVVPLNNDLKIPAEYMPSIILSDIFTVNSEAEMLALPTAKQGDICIRIDISKSFILTTSDPSSLANWQELLSPTEGVTSINGQTGSVTFEGAVTSILNTNLAASRVAISNGSGKIAASDVTLTELDNLSGTTSNIQNQLDSKATKDVATTSVDGLMSSGDKEKLNNIALNANNYILPTATATVKGGVELFSNTVQPVAANSVSSAADRTYGIQLNSSGQAVVNVPWTGTSYSGSTSIILSGSNLQRAALTGDVLASVNSNSTTIANNAVSNVKLGDMPEGTLKGRATAGTGDPQDLTASQVRSLLNVADGATANQTDSYLLDRTNHTGTQSISTVSGLQSILDGKATSAQGALADTALQPGDFGVGATPAMGQIRSWVLPTFQLGTGGENDEYLLLFPSLSNSAYRVSGHITSSRGGGGAGNRTTYEFIDAQSAFVTNKFASYPLTSDAVFTHFSIVEYNGQQFVAMRARTAGGVPNNQFVFYGTVINEHANLFRRVRGSDANVTIITENVKSATPLLNTESSIPSSVITGLGTMSTQNDSSVNISGGVIKTNNGSAGSPPISFASDPDTGLFRSNSDEVSVSAGGDQVLTTSRSGLKQNFSPVFGTTGGGWESKSLGTTVAGSPGSYVILAKKRIEGTISASGFTGEIFVMRGGPSTNTVAQTYHICVATAHELNNVPPPVFVCGTHPPSAEVGIVEVTYQGDIYYALDLGLNIGTPASRTVSISGIVLGTFSPVLVTNGTDGFSDAGKVLVSRHCRLNNDTNVNISAGDGKVVLGDAVNRTALSIGNTGVDSTVPIKINSVNVLTEGAHGLGTPINLTSFDDFTLPSNSNQLFSTGFQATGRPPGANYHSGIAFRHNTGADYESLLIFGAASTPNIYVRNKNNGIWGAPVSVLTELSTIPSSNISGLGTAATATLTTSKTSTTSDQVVKVGDYGIGLGMPVITSGSCRNLTVPGVYLVSSGVTDRPTGADVGILRVMAASANSSQGNNRLVHEYYTYGTNPTRHTCSYNGTTWGEWDEIYTSRSSIPVARVNGLGTAALANTGDFATAAQGALADTAIQPGYYALTDGREWVAQTIQQTEAETGTATTRRAWTAQRVRQATTAWWNSVSTTLGRTIVGRTNAAQIRDDLELGNVATVDLTTLTSLFASKGTEVPSGGTTGQVLAKSSNTSHAMEWINQSGGVQLNVANTWTANQTFNTGAIVNSGSASTPSIRISGSLTTGIYGPGSQQLGFSTNGVQRLNISNSLITSTVEVKAPSFDTGSSLKYKTNVKPFESALDKIMGIDVITYNRKLDEGGIEKKVRLGVSAESLAKVVPELVNFVNGEPDSVSYANGFALCVKAIQELVEELKKKE